MNRYIPHPLMSLGLLLMWLLLNRFSLGHVLLGGAIALVAGRTLAAIEPERLRVRSPWAMIKLFCRVGVDIVESNFQVARLILNGGRKGTRRSGFVEIPLTLRSPPALAILAVILTATPGTAWLEYDPESGILMIHVYDLRPEQDWSVIVRDRYETLLREIFE